MTMNRAVALAGTAAVTLVVLCGLYLGGSPSTQRSLRLDRDRISDLRTLTRAIEAHWDRTLRLPQNLEELVDGQRLRSMPLDPVSKLKYDFKPTAMNAYQLCAEFSEPSEKRKPKDFWAHEAGHQCFEFNLFENEKSSESRVIPREKD